MDVERLLFLTVVTHPGTHITLSYPYTFQMIPYPGHFLFSHPTISSTKSGIPHLQEISIIFIFLFMSILTFFSLEYYLFSRQAVALWIRPQLLLNGVCFWIETEFYSMSDGEQTTVGRIWLLLNFWNVN